MLLGVLESCHEFGINTRYQDFLLEISSNEYLQENCYCNREYSELSSLKVE